MNNNTHDINKKMRELIDILNAAAKAYYADGQEIMSNYEYDALYDELEELERSSGIRMSDSPTVRVGYEVLSELPKERHGSPMLSLDKTKEPETLKDFLGDKKGILSWKMDGLTIVLTYNDGELIKAVTRGNGEVGEIVTSNAKVFKNVPLKIPFKGRLIIRGEAVIHYSDFEKVNEQIPELEAKYKNPRNLCSGSVRQLDPSVTAKRNVRFYAFSLVEASGEDFKNSVKNQMEWLKIQGFDVVAFRETDAGRISEDIKDFEDQVKENDFPSDGLVLAFDDIAYGESLGRTAKFPRNAMAFKWKDETAETILRHIEWSASRTGLINPIAVFDTVELEGTSVSRASLHNISYVRALKLGIGDHINVFKANMIIPQIADNITGSDNLQIPGVCPVCSGATRINEDNGVETLYCTNPGCPAKHIKRFAHFVSRDAMNIEGLSEASIERFVQKHYLKTLPDLYHLHEHREEIIQMEGFGEKSYNKLMEAVEKSRKTRLYRLIYGLGITGIGLSGAKAVCALFPDPEECPRADEESLLSIDGVGGVLAKAFTDYFSDEENLAEYEELLKELVIEEESAARPDGNGKSFINGKTFVITGALTTFENRSQMKEYIEDRGGKVSGSVSAKTDYLINNDAGSSSSKNKKAQELGVKIVTEEEFHNLVKQQDLM